VTPRDIIRTAAVLGWLAGVAMILGGLPLAVALVAPVAAAACGFAVARWGPRLWLAVRIAVKLKREAKTGGSLARS